MLTDDHQTPGGEYQHVAVTGATGFLGGHLIEYLRKKDVRVTCLCRPQSKSQALQQQGFDVRTFDLRDDAAWSEALRDVDLVFHLAATVSANSRREFFQANAQIPAALGQGAASLSKPPTVVYCSTIAAAGPAERGTVRYPGMRPKPVSLYGASKRGGEIALTRVSDRVPISIVRPGIIFGPRNRELFPVFEAIARTRVHAVPGFRTPPLSFIHVADVCELMWRIARSGNRVPGPGNDQPSETSDEGTYFAVADEHWNYVQLGQEVAQALGVSHFRMHVPFPLPWVLAASFELYARLSGQTPPFNLDKIREAAAPSWACADPRLESELQWRFPQSLSGRLRETVDWYRTTGWLPRT